ncbi:MAG TPA: metal-dependent hydrolase [Vicinamibacterales bacterium]|jgi:inner membrane protein|nr:metal-dependent hydrolase [Vicinamibacterales bacterium]
MPTIFSHAIVATAVGQWWRRMPASFWWWTAICAMLPDIDVIAFSFGVPYDAMLGHRGFTHSMFFALIVGAAASWHLSHPSHLRTHASHPSHSSHPSHLALFLWFTAVTASHGVLDALTNGGRGIAFFAPFSGERYFFPWRPIQVSPIGAGFFSPRGLRVLASEAVWIWLPSAIIAASARVLAHVHRPDRGRLPLLGELRRASGRKARATDGSLQNRP